jgi:hypothetical protein
MERKRSRSARTCLEIIRPLAAWIQPELSTPHGVIGRRGEARRLVSALVRAPSSDHDRRLDQRGLERCLGDQPGR